MTQDYTALEAKARSWDRCYPGNLNIEVLVDELTDAIANLQRERDEAAQGREYRHKRMLELEAEAATLRARLEAVEGALREAREFIAETKNNPRDDGKIVEIIGRIDAALQEPQT